MRKLLYLGIILFTVMGSSGCMSSTVVKVNDIEIDKRYYMNIEELLKYSSVYMKENKKITKDEIVSFIVDNEVVYQHAKKSGYNASEKEIKTRYNNALDKRDSIVVNKEDLKEEKIDKEILKSICEKDIIIEKYKEDYINDITISDENIKNYYETHKDEFKNEEVRASHILISTQGENYEGLDKDKLYSQAEYILEKINQGERFEDLAETYSNDEKSGKNGGDIGFFLEEDKNLAFSQVAFSLEKNEVSPIFETVYGYHIVKVTDKRRITKSLEESREDIKSTLLKEEYIKQIEALSDECEISIK